MFTFLLAPFRLRHDNLKEDLAQDYESYLRIKKWFSGREIKQSMLKIYHPGSGSDILSILALYDAMVVKNRILDITFLDTRDFGGGVALLLKKYTQNPKMTVEYDRNKGSSRQVIKAAYKGRTIRIVYYTKDFHSFFPRELEGNIDIYYERGFEMFRSKDNKAMNEVFRNVKSGGLAVTDHGFNFEKEKKNFRKLKGIPKDFGLYGNFQIWQRIIPDIRSHAR